MIRPWDDGSDSLENAKRRLRAGFEFFQKLGVRMKKKEKTFFILAYNYFDDRCCIFTGEVLDFP